MDDDSQVIYSPPRLEALRYRHPSIPLQMLLQLPPPPTEKKHADYVYHERRLDDLSSNVATPAPGLQVKSLAQIRLALEIAIDLNLRCVFQCTVRPSEHC